MLQFLLVIGLFCIAQNWAQAVHNVELKRGEPYEIKNPGYPKDDLGWQGSSIEWNFQVETGAGIKVICDDIRMVQRDPWTEDCPHVYLSTTDNKGEKKVCGSSIHGFTFTSDGSNLKIKVVSDEAGTGLFKCIALNIGEPQPEEKVNLEPNGKAWRRNIFIPADKPVPYLDKVWEFESTPGTRMSFQCDLGVPDGRPDCGFSVLTFSENGSHKQMCKFSKLVWFTNGNKGKLRLQLGKEGHRWMDCLVQAVTGDHPDEYMNVVSKEVDSSEQGVTAGSRQTSCKCGWSNKNSARIINGEEARVNEYPWMVHLQVYHVTANGGYGSSCGASIITARHVLTAAHCVVSGKTVVRPENVQMILAKHDEKRPTGKEVTIGAEQFFIGERYLEKGLYFDDIAVIFTKQAIEFSPIIGPVCIEPEESPVINRNVMLMGWGLTEQKTGSTYLKKGKARVMHRNVCGHNPWDVCTTAHTNAFCSGDSGGPIVWLDPETNRFNELSLVSRSSSCVGKYSVSTLVSYYYNWIQDIIKATDPSMNTCHKI